MSIVLIIALLIQSTWVYSTPLIYTSLAALVSEKVGIIALWMEGILSIGAITGIIYAFNVPNPYVACLLTVVTSALFAAVYGIFVINFKAEQTISGIALNFIAPSIAMLLSRLFFKNSVSTPSLKLEQKLPRILNNVFEKNTFMDIVFNRYISEIFVFFVAFFIWFLFYKTRFGLRLIAVGKSHLTAQTLGINTKLIQYICVMIAGGLAGMGGLSYSMIITGSYRPSLIAGQGFISIAAMIFGRWTPQGAFLGAILFGFTTGLGILLGLPALNLHISSMLLSMIPYIITILVLMLNQIFKAKNSKNN